MQIAQFVFNPIQVNSYLLIDDASSEAILIDAGMLFEKEKAYLSSFLDEHNITIKRLINTHLHLDHCFGNRYIAEKYGILPEAHADDEELLGVMRDNARMWNIPFNEEPQPLGSYLAEGDQVVLGDITLDVLHIPGHSKGGLAFHNAREHVLFSGDSLFRYSIGRTDLPGGDYSALITNITDKLLTLPADTIVYPGHGNSTTIKEEIENNPYL